MKSALLAQNDNLAIENLKQKVGRSVFDLSHSTTFPIDVDGSILPICCIETVPSDSFEISCECLLRQLSPLQVPLMANFRLNTAWFWCDNRLAWKKWDRFMTGGRTGNEVYELPRISNIDTYVEETGIAKKSLYDVSIGRSDNCFKNINYKNCLHTYFGISMNLKDENAITDETIVDTSNELPLAFPFFDYQIICRDFYTNVDRLKQERSSTAWYDFYDYGLLDSDWRYDNLFPADDDEIRLVDGVQSKSGFDSGDDSSEHIKGFMLDKVRYHNVRDDYFVSSKKAPMRGDAPTINAVQGSIKLPSGSSISLNKVRFTDGLSPNSGLRVNGVSQGSVSPLTPEASIAVKVDSSGNVVSDVEGKTLKENTGLYVQGSDSNIMLSETSEDIEFGGDFVVDVTAGELRLLSQLTVWKELNMLHEPYYNDFLNAHFEGVSVGESAVEKPQFIGGTSQNISINEVLQTSQSSETSPLGNQGATAMSLASNYVGKYYCNNYGYLIGVAYIITDMYYNPALPRWASRRTKEDFYSPEFANLSMQAILNKEIYFSNDDEWNNTPWGYVGSFDELRTVPNRVAGDLLNDDYTDLKKWVIRREFDNDNKPSMSSEFLSLKDNVDKTAWSVPTMPSFMLQCANYIKAVRPMPKVAIPKAL